MTRSRTCVWSIASLKPRQSAISLVGRVAQHRVAAADQHRHVGDGDVKAIEQRLHAGVALEVEVGVRMAVARQELLDAQRARASAPSRSARRRRGRCAISSTRRRMKARIRISLSSASVCTSASSCSRSSSIDLAVLAGARRANSARRPESMLISPVNCPGPCDGDQRLRAVGDRRTTSTAPRDDDEERHAPASPASTSTSPARIGRRRPCAATRAICAAVSVGNTWSARAPDRQRQGGLSGMLHLTHGRFGEKPAGGDMIPRIDYRKFSPEPLQAMLAMKNTSAGAASSTG